MLRTLRHARGLALFALLVFSGSVPVSISALLHEGADDVCQLQVVAHDESAHRIGASRLFRPDAPHCIVCHWLQSVQTVVTSTGLVVPTSGCHHLAVSNVLPARVAEIAQVAARAPPAI